MYKRQHTDRGSTSGYLLTMNGGMLAWSSSKQKCISLSSTEAEYVGLSECCRSIMRTRNVLLEIGCNVKTVVLYEDNQSCTAWIKSSSKCAKHIDVKYHYGRKLHEQEFIELIYCKTADMLADIMTKPLGRTKFERIVLDVKMPITVPKTVTPLSEEEC